MTWPSTGTVTPVPVPPEAVGGGTLLGAVLLVVAALTGLARVVERIVLAWRRRSDGDVGSSTTRAVASLQAALERADAERARLEAELERRRRTGLDPPPTTPPS